MVEKIFSEIEQELRKRYPDFGEKAADEFRESLRDLQGRVSSIELSYVCNLELKPMPMLIITLEDGTQRFLIYDPFYEEVFEETDFYSSYSSLSEMLCLDSLDPEIDCFELPYREVEELRHYGNRFAVIFEDEDEYVKVRGVFLDKVIEFEAPCEALGDGFESKVIDVMEEVKGVLRTYSWHPVDPWRGYYEGAKSANGFVKVVEGWIGLGSDDPSVERLAELARRCAPR